MRLLGYGEDVLTLWALTEGLPAFLSSLNDPTPPSEITVVYRPSLGRNAPGRRRSLRAEFGEFDAIVITAGQVYLVEAKWSGSSELKDGGVSLRPAQQHRHTVLKWYRDAWAEGPRSTWDHFRAAHAARFAAEFRGMAMPKTKTKLARNLELLLNLTLGRAKPQDVLLFTAVADDPVPHKVHPSSFKLVVMRSASVGGAGYVELAR